MDNPVYFIDTNILIKYYYEEDDTSIIRDFISNNSIYISNWSLVEFTQALKKILFIQGLDKSQRHQRVKDFQQTMNLLLWNIAEEIFIVHPMPKSFAKEVSKLIEEYGVKNDMGMNSGDAMQIVAYQSLKIFNPNVIFVTHDKALKSILNALGNKVFDPCKI